MSTLWRSVENTHEEERMQCVLAPQALLQNYNCCQSWIKTCSHAASFSQLKRKVYFSFYVWFSEILLDEFNHLMFLHGNTWVLLHSLYSGVEAQLSKSLERFSKCVIYHGSRDTRFESTAVLPLRAWFQRGIFMIKTFDRLDNIVTTNSIEWCWIDVPASASWEFLLSFPNFTLSSLQNRWNAQQEHQNDDLNVKLIEIYHLPFNLQSHLLHEYSLTE